MHVLQALIDLRSGEPLGQVQMQTDADATVFRRVSVALGPEWVMKTIAVVDVIRRAA